MGNDDYKTFYLVSRRGWFTVFPVAIFESKPAADEYADWLSDNFHQSYSVQPVAQAD